MNTKRILVPIDFSDTSRAALREAAELAERFKARVTLLHVHAIDALVIADYTYAESPRRLAEACETAEKELRHLAEKHELEAGRFDVAVKTGSPAKEIIQASREHDLIVMSTHGRSGLGRFLLGSVAERVVSGAHCSVLVVRNEAGGPRAEI